jgi:hypothetical protein
MLPSLKIGRAACFHKIRNISLVTLRVAKEQRLFEYPIIMTDGILSALTTLGRFKMLYKWVSLKY